MTILQQKISSFCGDKEKVQFLQWIFDDTYFIPSDNM